MAASYQDQPARTGGCFILNLTTTRRLVHELIGMRLDMIDENQNIPGKVNCGQAGLAKWQG